MTDDESETFCYIPDVQCILGIFKRKTAIENLF